MADIRLDKYNPVRYLINLKLWKSLLLIINNIHSIAKYLFFYNHTVMYSLNYLGFVSVKERVLSVCFLLTILWCK